MKTINKPALIAVISLVLVVFFAACAKKNTDSGENVTLAEIVEDLYENVDVPPYETISLDESNFEYYAFAPYDSSYIAVAADALVNITPHSMVVINSEDGNGGELAKTIAENADLNKWLCVGSEAGGVAYTDHYVVLIMSEKETVDSVIDNFREMVWKLDGMRMKLISLSNARYDD